MAKEIAALAEKKLLVVTGKGGAGKSLLSLALAHRLSTLGKRVWLVEIGRRRDQDFTRLPSLVGKKSLTHEPQTITLPGTKQKIQISVLDPTQSLAEYVDLKLPTGGLAGVLLNNRVTASFLEVVPGLPDLVALGKLWHAVTQKNQTDAPDIVILDAPATGHAIALLNAPANFKRITRMGPIFRDASLMAEFLGSPEKTGIVLTSLPEEMSIQETLELHSILSRDFPAPQIVVNKCFPRLEKISSENPKSVVWKAYQYSYRRAIREQQALAEIKSLPSKNLPFFFPEPDAPALFLRISEEFS